MTDLYNAVFYFFGIFLAIGGTLIMLAFGDAVKWAMTGVETFHDPMLLGLLGAMICLTALLPILWALDEKL